jgi:hypothetical protein
MTDIQAAEIIAFLAASYPNAKIPEATVEIYIEFLTPMDYNEVTAASRRIVKTAKFFPTIAEITEAVEKVSPDQLPDADQAWGEVMQQLSSVGHIGVPQFSHDAIREAVKAMGWINLCLSENVGVDRGQFIKIYNSVKNRHKDNAINTQVLQLVGGIGLLGEGK